EGKPAPPPNTFPFSPSFPPGLPPRGPLGDFRSHRPRAATAALREAPASAIAPASERGGAPRDATTRQRTRLASVRPCSRDEPDHLAEIRFPPESEPCAFEPFHRFF